MSATGKTTNFNLPLYNLNDSIAFIPDWNDLATAVDTNMQINKVLGNQNSGDIANINADIDGVNATINDLNTLIKNLSIKEIKFNMPVYSNTNPGYKFSYAKCYKIGNLILLTLSIFENNLQLPFVDLDQKYLNLGYFSESFTVEEKEIAGIMFFDIQNAETPTIVSADILTLNIIQYQGQTSLMAGSISRIPDITNSEGVFLRAGSTICFNVNS